MRKIEISLFPAEAFRRYFLRCGAPSAEALNAAMMMVRPSAADHVTFGWMPSDPNGKKYTIASFRGAIADFSKYLPSNGRDWLPAQLQYVAPGDGSEQEAGEGKTALEPEIVLGLTGGRGAGKSFLSKELSKLGFNSCHPFNPGKALLRGYYVARGASEEEAWEMTDGSLKDKPAPEGVLPINPETGAPYTSRWLMERLGRYMGQEMGVDTTIGRELSYCAGLGIKRLLVDSVIYEEAVIRGYENSIIIKLAAGKPGMGPGIVADISDASVAKVRADAVLTNHMDGAERLMADFHAILEEHGLSLREEVSEPAGF